MPAPGDRDADLRRALRDIAAGRGVRRGDHTLVDERGVDHTARFREALAAEGYEPTTIRDCELRQGERLPAWLVQEGVARFGYVFWERFFDTRARKIFGTVHKDAKGDWDVIVGGRSLTPLYVNPRLRERVDPDNPSQW